MTRRRLFQMLEKEARRLSAEHKAERKVIQAIRFDPTIREVHARAIQKIRTFHSKSFVKGGMHAYDLLVAEQRQRKILGK